MSKRDILNNLKPKSTDEEKNNGKDVGQSKTFGSSSYLIKDELTPEKAKELIKKLESSSHFTELQVLSKFWTEGLEILLSLYKECTQIPSIS